MDLEEILLWSTRSMPKPEKMNEDDSPFYLAVNNNLKAGSLQTKDWFKAGPIGRNKLNSLMKTVAQKTGINNERLRNHSNRKAVIQALSENDIPPTHIAQLSGHKNLKSIEDYSKVSTKQQMQMSKVLSSVMLVLQPRRPREKLIQPFVHPLLNHSNLW